MPKPTARSGARVGATADLVPTLDAAFKAGGVQLVTVPIDYSENIRVLVDELKAREQLARGRNEARSTVAAMRIEVRSPYDGAPVGAVEATDADGVERALETAHRALPRPPRLAAAAGAHRDPVGRGAAHAG